MYKLFVLTAVLACASAGYISPYTTYSAAPSYGHPFAPPAITSQSSNILRSFGNLGQVSTYHKTVDTPYSSVSKSDIRVSNPGISTYAAAPYAYGSYASPYAYKAGYLGYAAAAAPVVAHISYDSPIVHYAW